MQHFEVDGAVIEYQVQGNGEPVLLIPPSLVIDGLAPVVTALTFAITVVVITCPDAKTLEKEQHRLKIQESDDLPALDVFDAPSPACLPGGCLTLKAQDKGEHASRRYRRMHPG